MYLEMIKTILGIEFYEGVHSETESGDFFYISQRNHVVLDNFMAQSGRDKRISDEARVKRLGRGCRYTRKRQRREPHRGGLEAYSSKQLWISRVSETLFPAF